MKKVALLLSVTIIPMLATAQSHWYLAPSLNVGVANITQNYVGEPNIGGVLGYGLGVGLGYKIGNWRLESGLQYLNSGYQINTLIFGSQFNPSNPAGSLEDLGSVRFNYQHLGIPVKIGYTLHAGGKLSFVPSLGVLTTYNFGATYHNDFDSSMVASAQESGSIKKDYRTISFWGTAAVLAQYKINNSIAVFAGPTANYMLGNFYKTPDNAAYPFSQHNYTIACTAGINIQL